MTRFNYLAPRLERCGLAVAPDAVRAVRAPALAVLCAAAFAVVLHAIELERLDAARRAGGPVRRALVALQPSLDATRALERDVARLRARAAARAALRRSGDDAANEIARTANLLPDDAWLASVRVEPAQLALDGRARSVDAVAQALGTLTASRPGGSARLVSARSEADAVTYAIAVERAP